MEETTVTIIGMFIGLIIMFIVPLTLIADRSDDIAQLLIQTATTEFVDDIIRSGQITRDRYEDFISSLQVSGNMYEIDIEVKYLDENTSKAVTDNDYNKIGNNSYYSIYTSQIEEKIGLSDSITENNRMGRLILKQGDGILVTVKNDSQTLSQTLKSFYNKIKGEDIHILSATASGTIAIDGDT